MLTPNESELAAIKVPVPVRRTAIVAAPPAQVEIPRASAPVPFSFGELLRRALRGRYALVISLGLIFGALGGAACWMLVTPTYRSAGLLRIAYELPTVDRSTDQNQPIGPMFDTFMQSQKLLITSSRVVNRAMGDKIWKGNGYQLPADAERYFARNLAVDIRPRSEFIQISVTDRDPGMAATAANAIVNAYAEIYKDRDDQLERERIGVLEARIKKLEGQVEAEKQTLDAAVRKYGTTDLEMSTATAEARLTKLENAISELKLFLAVGPDGKGASQSTGPTTRPQQQKSQELSVEQIAAVDPVMSGLLAEQIRVQNDLERLRSHGYLDQHKDVVDARLRLQQTETQIDHEADTFRKFHASTGQNLSDPTSRPVLTAGKSRAELEDNLTKLTGLYNDAHDHLLEIGNQNYRLREANRQLGELRADLVEKKKRIETLEDQGAIGGRLTIIATPEPPLSPELDHRLKVVPAGVLAGGCLPAGFFVLLTLLRRRYHYSEDTQADVAGKVPLLGILPELASGDPPEKMLGAAQSIHQIRVLLQSQAPQDGSNIYLITSANAAEGKTSLTMSLGLSFAASKLRTLIIDCDLVGRSLSRSLEARDMKGLNEALAAGSLRQLVRKTKSGLFILPAGNSHASDACALAADAIRTLFAEARKYFDVVLVDSGPILGSVEAAVLAREVDGVIFTIARGQHRSVVEKGTRRLQTLGVRLEGFIFNRAKPQDFDRSPFSSSSRSSIADAGERLAPTASPETMTRFGPLVQAVACGIPITQN